LGELAINGERLRFERMGTGEPLLLIHSLGTGAWMWREQFARWQPDFDVIAFDARGHGGSTHHGAVSVEAIARDLHAALRTMNIESIAVVAISMGGPILAHLHALAPGLVSRAVIADSFARQGPAGLARVEGLTKMLSDISMRAYGEDYATGTLLPTTHPRHFEALVGSIAAMDRDAYLETARSVFTSDVAGIMQTFTMPVHVVVGAADNRTPPLLSQEIAGLVPRATLAVIDDAAHLANLDNPDAFHAAVEPFLRNTADA